MAVLSDAAIADAIGKGELAIDSPEGEMLVNPRTGHALMSDSLNNNGYALHPWTVYSWHRGGCEKSLAGRSYYLNPGELAIIETYERVALGGGLTATIHSLARYTMLGLSAISTTVNPYWGTCLNKKLGDEDGSPRSLAPQPLWIAVANNGPARIELSSQKGFCRLLFHRMEGKVDREAPLLSEVRHMFKVAQSVREEQLGIRRKIWGTVKVVAVMIATFVVIGTPFWIALGTGRFVSLTPTLAGLLIGSSSLLATIGAPFVAHFVLQLGRRHGLFLGTRSLTGDVFWNLRQPAVPSDFKSSRKVSDTK